MWSVDDLLTATAGRLKRPGSMALRDFSIDSRTLQPGQVFVAIKGETFDGHSFIVNALQAGAGAIIAQRPPTESEAAITSPAGPAAWVSVPDPLAALQAAARFQRARHAALFIGVTGSNGKTTTKEMLRHLFGGIHRTWATEGNFNNHIGLPLGLTRIPLDTETAIIEMGMNHLGEIRFLADIARPRFAAITNIGTAHIGMLGSKANIARAKAEILEILPPNGRAVVPDDPAFLPLWRERSPAPLLVFGLSRSCHLWADAFEDLPNGVACQIHHGLETSRFALPVLGRHNVLNALAALGLWLAAGHPLDRGLARLSSFKPVGARMEEHRHAGRTIVLDCYNANPDSMKAAIEFLQARRGRRIAVLGDMRELGETTRDAHREIGRRVAEAGLEVLVAVGADSLEMGEAALQAGMDPTAVHLCPTTGEASSVLQLLHHDGDTILLKASRGMHFEEIVKAVWPHLPCDLH
jgi:UDP-N-acetylmuramoyl-tripeptide--D-alanyl-D-alanine ligase